MSKPARIPSQSWQRTPTGRSRASCIACMCSFSLLFRSDFADDSETDQAVLRCGHGPITVRRSAGPCFVEPTSTSNDDKKIVVKVSFDNAERRSHRVLLWAVSVIFGVIPIGTPLGNVSVHIVQTESIRLVASDLGGFSQVRSLFRIAAWEIAIEIGIAR